jgi:hypothetical protein
MPYSVKSRKSNTDYFLHKQRVETRSGSRELYFFRKQIKEGAQESLPPGYVISENPRTGLPLLKRA